MAKQIGYINANIAGDSRYSSNLNVTVEGDQVTVTLSENGAAGGMDGGGGSTPFRVTATATCSTNPSDIVKTIKQVMNREQPAVISRYGKPTKNFNWRGVAERGLSQRLVIKALSFLDE